MHLQQVSATHLPRPRRGDTDKNMFWFEWLNDTRSLPGENLTSFSRILHVTARPLTHK